MPILPIPSKSQDYHGVVGGGGGGVVKGLYPPSTTHGDFCVRFSFTISLVILVAMCTVAKVTILGLKESLHISKTL